MKTLVVYDSVFDNTAIVARAIGAALAADVQNVRDAVPTAVNGLDLLVVGSPTHGGRPTPAIDAFLKAIPASALEHVRVAAFDTRISASERALPLRLLMNVIGYAGPKIAKALRAQGGELITSPAGFIVEDKEGPLRPGEEQRAKAWLEQFVKVA
jgi:flavodoxin